MPIEHSRKTRVAEELKRLLAMIIHEEVSNPHVGMVSVTAVELSRDYKYAKVYVSALELAGAGSEESVEALNSSLGFIGRELRRRYKARTLPKLKFYADNTERDAVDLAAQIRQAREVDEAAQQRRGGDAVNEDDGSTA